MEQSEAGAGPKQPRGESVRRGELPEIEDRRAAYSLLVETHESTLLRSARRMCNGEEDLAQDLVQDALIRGYQVFLDGSFREGSNARAWLLRILANGFINSYNHRKKWEADCNLDNLTERAHVHAEFAGDREYGRPEESLLKGTLDEPLMQALASLPREYRICVLLVDVEGLEYADAAAALNIPIGTVRSRLSRARLHLYKLLYDYARDRRHL